MEGEPRLTAVVVNANIIHMIIARTMAFARFLFGVLCPPGVIAFSDGRFSNRM